MNDWTSNFESKVSSFVTLVAQLDEAEAKNLGKKDIDVYPLRIVHILFQGEQVCLLYNMMYGVFCIILVPYQIRADMH